MKKDELKRFAERGIINPKLFIGLLIGLIVVGTINVIILLGGGLYELKIQGPQQIYKINKLTGTTWQQSGDKWYRISH